MSDAAPVPDSRRLPPAVRIILRRSYRAGTLSLEQFQQLLRVDRLQRLADHAAQLIVADNQPQLLQLEPLDSVATGSFEAVSSWLAQHPLLNWLWQHRQQILEFALTLLEVLPEHAQRPGETDRYP